MLRSYSRLTLADPLHDAELVDGLQAGFVRAILSNADDQVRRIAGLDEVMLHTHTLHDVGRACLKKPVDRNSVISLYVKMEKDVPPPNDSRRPPAT